MEKTRDYIRYLNTKEIKYLQSKYSDHLKHSRGGILSQDRRKRLLHKTNWDKEDIKITHQYRYNYFYEIRESVKGAFSDLVLLCDTLTNNQIKEIFELNVPHEFYYKIEERAKRNELQDIVDSIPALENIVRSVLMSEDQTNTSQNKSSTVETQPDSWKFELSYRLIRTCFVFLEKNHFITSKAHRRLIEETTDMLDSERHNTSLSKSERSTVRIRKDSLVDPYLGISD